MGWGKKSPTPIYDWAQKGGQSQLLWDTIGETVDGMEGLETEWDKEKLVGKIRDYFWKASKKLTVKKDLQAAVDEYAEHALGTMFAGLWDREWLQQGLVDFTAVLDAGCQCCLSIDLLNTVQREEYGAIVEQSYIRAFEECKFGPLLHEAVANAVSGPKIKKKLSNSVESGRSDALQSEDVTSLEDYVACWIKESIGYLANETGGAMDSVIEANDLALFFHNLFQAGALPSAYTQDSGLPPNGWPLVDETVHMVYNGIADGSLQPPKKKRKW